MLFMLLINTASSLNVEPEGNQDSGDKIVIEVNNLNLWSWQQYRDLSASEAISLLPESKVVQLKVAAKVDAQTLFANFQLLHQAGVTYSFSTVEGL